MFNFLQTRLGPKPFSTESAEVSFDKVFAVPTPPSNDKETKNLVNEDDRELLKVEPQITEPPPPAIEDVSWRFFYQLSNFLIIFPFLER